jgi:membrane-associated protease RseP (regulator of RpoE activity)
MAYEDVLLFLGFILGWLLLLWVLKRAGKIESPEEPAEPEGAPEVGPGSRVEPRGTGFALMGPFLMWKTRRGRQLIDRIAQRRRFWRFFGDLSIAVVFSAMVLVTGLFVWLATLVGNVPPGREPAPLQLLGLPGLNPLIPLWYGILGLAVAIIVHEFCHGILARVSKIRVNSLGLLFFIVPIGAFVEPDEAEMKAMPRHERLRLYAVGPAVNIFLALLFAILFSVGFMSSVSPAADGVPIGAVVANGPAADAGILPGTILLTVNGTRVHSYGELTDVMANTTAGQNVTLTLFRKSNGTYDQVVPLADAFVFTNDTSRMGVGFLGISGCLSPNLCMNRISTAYFHPIEGADAFGGLARSSLAYISLPLIGLQPMQGVAADFYTVDGPLAGLGEGAFWTLANMMYWLFWLNLMLGVTNALPAVPLDGGYIFRDGIHAIMARFRSGMAVERREKVAKNVSYAFALLILTLIVWQLVGPRLL